MRVLWVVPLAFSCGSVDHAKPDAAVAVDAMPDAACTGSASFAFTGSIQMFTVPCDRIFTITAAGAAGGDSGPAHTPGGKGAIAVGSFSLLANDTLSILV